MEFIFILVWIASIIISVFLNYLISKAFSEAAEAKGFYEKKYFWYCFFFGTIGYLLVISLPHRLYSAQHSDSYKHSNNPILENNALLAAQAPQANDSFDKFLAYAISYSSDEGMRSYLKLLSEKPQFSDQRDNLLRILNHTPSERQRAATEVLMLQIQNGAN